MSSLPTGTVTFLFTDIEGSTQLWERFPDAMPRALTRHDQLLHEIIEANDGRIVKNLGDGFYAVFRRAGDAVAAAQQAQQAFHQWREDNGRAAGDQPPVRVRMGIHTGEAELREDDYHGTVLNRADRIMSAGHGGQILISSTTAAICEGALPPGAAIRDMGEHRLRGLTRPERIYQLVMPELPANFPPLRSLGEYVVSLPTPATRFVGRGPEVDQIVALLNDPAIRLLSLVGPGGTGKTRLAIEAAAKIGRAGEGRFLDGVYFVPLAPLYTRESMVTAVAQTVGFRFRQSDESIHRQLLDYLRRKSILLVMDNFEHLLAYGAADLPAEILENAADVVILATSRTRLNVQGEHLLTIGGMRAPDAYTIRRWQSIAASDEDAEAAFGDIAGEFAAVRLFAQCAARVRPGFRLAVDNISDVARICRQVQGLPLGIELAAAWMEALSLPDISDEIDRNLDILATEQRGVPDRQRSIRAVFDTSWALLTDRERGILPMLSVFRGGFAREAAEFLAAATIRDLLGLVSKSWLQPGAELGSAAGLPALSTFPLAASGRFQLHALLRQYAEEKLAGMADLEERARERHARYFARFLESNMRRMIGSDQARAFDAVAEEFDDIHQAWEWWTRRGEFGRLVDQMLLPLFLYAAARFVGPDAAPLLDMAIAALPPPGDASGDDQALNVARASLLIARTAIFANYFTREFAPGDIHAAWAITEAIGPDAPQRLGIWYAMLNLIYGLEVEREPALANLRAFIERPFDHSEGGSPVEGEMVLAYARQSLARLLIREFAPEADLLEARRHLQAAREVFEHAGNHDASASAYIDDAEVSSLLGRFDEALTLLDRARPAAESVGNWGLVWIILLTRREVYLRQGQPERMFPVFDEMLTMSRRVGNFRLECWTLGWDSIYAMRYHSVERALFKRQGAMLLAEEFGLEYDRAWSALELGDIHRLMGDAAAARRWFDAALPLFRQINEEMGFAFYHRALGDLALGRGDWAEAQEHHRIYGNWGRDRDTWSLIYALCGMGRAALGLGRPDEALAVLREALGLAVNSGRRDTLSLPVACLAQLCAAAGHDEMAATLAAAAVESPLTWIEVRAMARELAGETAAVHELDAVTQRLLAIEAADLPSWLAAAAESMLNPPAN